MRSIKKRAVLALSCIAVAAFTAPAFSKPTHHRHGHRSMVRSAPAPATFTSQADSNTIAYPQPQLSPVTGETPVRGRRGRLVRSRPNGVFASADPMSGTSLSLAGGGLVSEARRYLGTNPTGKGSLWCGNFMNLVLERSGYQPSASNQARSFAGYGHRIAGPQVGAIAVMSRRGGGHVGVVTGFDENGNPIVISGNHNRTVAEAVYPRGRIFAYMMPN